MVSMHNWSSDAAMDAEPVAVIDVTRAAKPQRCAR